MLFGKPYPWEMMADVLWGFCSTPPPLRHTLDCDDDVVPVTGLQSQCFLSPPGLVAQEGAGALRTKFLQSKKNYLLTIESRYQRLVAPDGESSYFQIPVRSDKSPSGFPGKRQQRRTMQVFEAQPVTADGELCCPAKRFKKVILLLHDARSRTVHLG